MLKILLQGQRKPRLRDKEIHRLTRNKPRSRFLIRVQKKEKIVELFVHAK